MLVLSRACGEGIQIGTVEIAISRVKDGRVWIAIQAPDHIEIARTELLYDGDPRARCLLASEMAKRLDEGGNGDDERKAG